MSGVSAEQLGVSEPDLYSMLLAASAQADRQRRVDELAAECGDRAFAATPT